MDAVRKCQEFVAAIALCALGACAADNSGGEPSATCSVQILVTYAAPTSGAARDTLVGDLERMAAVRLTYLRGVGPSIDVYLLNADDRCADALERLRHDARVRAVDLDERRRPLT